jgi:DNA-binding NarL/FixJ family response regulator
MNFKDQKFAAGRNGKVPAKIRILLVDDHSVVRQGLCALIQNFSDLEIIGEATNGLDAVEFAKKLKPDVVLMDLILPKLDGVQATRKVVKENPQIKVLVLTTVPDWYKVHVCLEAGACGYLIKTASSGEIFSAIRQAHAGQLAFSAQVCQLIQERRSGSGKTLPNGEPEPRRRPNQLSPRESQVLCLIADGSNNKDISDQLAISVKTVEKHRQRVMDKLNLHDVASLTRYAISNGLVQENAQPSAKLMQA